MDLPSFNSLKELFLQIGREREWKLLGSEDHCKYEPGYCRIDYDEWGMYEGRKDFVIHYDDNIVTFIARKRGDDFENNLSYNVNRAYLSEQLEFLKKLDSGFARTLADVKENDWMQIDEKNTEAMYTLSWDDYSDVYSFLKGHIEQRFKEF